MTGADLRRRLLATVALVDAGEPDLPAGDHGCGWAIPIIAVAAAGLALAALAAHDLLRVIAGAIQ
jgi:hypothetical protein